MERRTGSLVRWLAATFVALSAQGEAATTVTTPYLGITYTERIGENVAGRNVSMRILEIDLDAPGIGFALTPAGGTRDTVRQSTLGFLNATDAQFAVNSHFFLPFPSSDTDANLVGFAASNGTVISSFEAPIQNYALVTNSPAINIAPDNSGSVVHADTSFADGRHVVENVTLGTAFAGSAQIVTNGTVTIPQYQDASHPDALLTVNQTYSNANSWYNLFNARTAIGLTQDNSTLVIFTVDRNTNAARGPLSDGLSVGQVAQIMIDDYGVWNGLNMDGGGSTTLAMRDPVSGIGGIVNVPNDTTPGGRLEGSNIAIFAAPVPEPETYALMVIGLGMVVMFRRRSPRS
ncbi:MAG: phosphodiester glycosidase family protein [Betaproteobacteria bacterium]|nr:phosphodiester glycosidase family protein [Betaproteobacteria bacterium]